jgi:hypothetical protein
MYSQFQQSQIGVAVVSLVLALLGDIFLEYRGGFRVVPVQTIEDGVDVLRPVLGHVECDSHVCWFV